ncbi:MAG: hypothetical protein QNK20_14445 [Aureibaculum sp.]|nr:hypothetical protein [Aureibaculum sp.]
MSKIDLTTDPNNSNHVRYDYTVDKIFLNFPNQQKNFTFVNGTAAERTIPAGTLVGVTTADQTIAQEVVAAATDGSQIPKGFTLYDIVIPAGAAEEVEGLVGVGDSQTAIFEDMITLNAAETLETVVTSLGISIRSAIIAYTPIKLETAAQNLSNFKDAQV